MSLGVFRGEPLEASWSSPSRRAPPAVTEIDYALRAVAPAGWIVRLQAPLSLDDESEPDLAVAPGLPGDYRDAHPARPALAVEVAESSLELDRARKGSLYARATISDYWIVNLVEGVVEIHRDPEADPSAVFGWRHRSATRLAPPASVAPLAWSRARIAVADLLP